MTPGARRQELRHGARVDLGVHTATFTDRESRPDARSCQPPYDARRMRTPPPTVFGDVCIGGALCRCPTSPRRSGPHQNHNARYHTTDRECPEIAPRRRRCDRAAAALPGDLPAAYAHHRAQRSRRAAAMERLVARPGYHEATPGKDRSPHLRCCRVGRFTSPARSAVARSASESGHLTIVSSRNDRSCLA